MTGSTIWRESEVTSRRQIRVLQLGGAAGMFGAERWILALSRYLPATDVSVHVGAVQDESGGTPPLCRQAAGLGLPTFVIAAPGRLSLSAIPALRRFVREHKIDVLHTHGYKSDVLGVLATVGLGCAHVATPHGWSTRAGPKLRVYEMLDRLAFAWCDAVAPLSDDLQDEIRRLPWVKGNVRMIRNGVDLSEVRDAGAVVAEVALLRAQGAEIFGYIGQLIPRKRIDTLIRAFAELRSGEKHLFLVGDGPARSDLEQLARTLGVSARVHFTGFRNDRLSFLKGFDVFVLPSLLEGIPRCVMEALAAGIAVIASDIEGCRTIVRNEETGLLFAPGNHDALLRQMERLRAHPELRARLGGAGRTLIWKEFSAEEMAKRYVELYRDLVDRSRGPTHTTNARFERD